MVYSYPPTRKAAKGGSRPLRYLFSLHERFPLAEIPIKDPRIVVEIEGLRLNCCSLRNPPAWNGVPLWPLAGQNTSVFFPFLRGFCDIVKSFHNSAILHWWRKHPLSAKVPSSANRHLEGERAIELFSSGQKSLSLFLEVRFLALFLVVWVC